MLFCFEFRKSSGLELYVFLNYKSEDALVGERISVTAAKSVPKDRFVCVRFLFFTPQIILYGLHTEYVS